MHAQKPSLDAAVGASPAPGLPAPPEGKARERHAAAAAARPTVAQPPAERLSGPFRVKPGYLERRAWPFSAQD